MNKVWKPLAIGALLTTAILFGSLLSLALRGREDNSLLQRNVTEQIRFHLEHREPERAASVLEASISYLGDPAVENGLRLEIARAGTPELGSKMLEGLVLAAMDRAQAALAAQARVDIQRKLFESIVLEDGALPAPFEAPALRASKARVATPEARKAVAEQLRSAIAERRDLARRAGEAPDPALERLEASVAAARYALGELPFERVPLPDDESRVRFGDLLYRERQFDRAIEVWTPVLTDPRVAHRIAELAALRRIAPKALALWDYDLERLPKRDPAIDAEAVKTAEGMLQNAIPGRLPGSEATVRGVEPDPIFFDPSITGEISPAIDPQQLYLLVEHRGFEFSAGSDRPFLTKAAPEIRLSSAYAGPIRFRLYRVRTLQALQELDAATLVSRRSELEEVRSWEESFAPLRPPGKDAIEWGVGIPSCPAGLYVLRADARYCPVYAFCRFVVSDVALVLLPATDRVLVYAVDRLSGLPVPELPLEGKIQGHRILPPQAMLPPDDSVVEEYRRGYLAGWAKGEPEVEATPSYLRGHAAALKFREENPDVVLDFKGRSDRDGVFEWPVAPAWRDAYQYSLRVASADPTMPTHVESGYRLDEGRKELRVLAYSDRPIYHPGDKVSFKAILRLKDDEGVKPYEGTEALVEIVSSQRSFLTRSLPVTGFGTLSGSFELPQDCPTGLWSFRINNQFHVGSFDVADYRKPDAELLVEAPAEARAGEEVPVRLHARRFSGEPIARTRVRVILKTGLLANESFVEDPVFPSKAPMTWDTREERDLQTDDEGRVSFTFKCDPGPVKQYFVYAGLEQEFLREIVGGATVEVRSRSRQIQVETERPSYHPGEIARLRFLIPGATLARIEERGEGEKRFLLNVPLKDGAGACEVPLTPTTGSLSIGVRDGEVWTWAPVPLRVVPQVTSSELVALRLDHPSYRTGETARVEITSTEPDASVLFIVATGKIHRRQVVKLAKRRAELELAVRDEDVPNVHLVALSVKNDRVGKASLELLVPPIDRFLTLELQTDRKEYRPGETCKVTLRALDRQGRPVPDCELSLGVVDEAVYDVRRDLTPDLRTFFHRYSRPLHVKEAFFYTQKLPPFEIWKTLVFLRGTANLYDTLGIGKGGGGGGRYGGRFGGRENLVARGGGTRGTVGSRAREEFRDTAYWNAHLVTGPDGTATASFPFPDNLTSFRFTARGITRAHQVGEIRQESVVRKPFFVTLGPPRVLQEGNGLTIAGVVHNHTERPQTLKPYFRAPFPLESSPGAITLLPGASAKVDARIEVDRYLPEVELEFGADADSGERDAMRVRVPGARRGSPHAEGRSGSVAAGTPREEVFRLPAGTIEGTLQLTVDVDAGLHTAIAGALDGLIEYPYGCVEQTMSRFLPAVAARRALGELPLRFREKLPAVIAAGLQRLYTLQKENGSWSWWSGETRDSRSDRGITAYVLYGLSLCKKAGVGVDRNAVDRAAKWLKSDLIQASLPPPMALAADPRFFTFLALSEYESAWAAPSEDLRRAISTWTDRADGLRAADAAVLGLAALRRGMTREAERLAPIAESVEPADVATASLLLQFQAARGGDLAPSVRLLLSRRSGRGWGNTMESAFAILGLAAAIERPNPGLEASPGRVQISVNGAPVQEILLRNGLDAAFDGRVTIPAPAGGWTEKAVVRFSFDGEGAAYYTATLEAMLADAGRPPVSQGFEIKREYYERRGDGWLPVDGPIAPGRLVLVVLDVRGSHERPYLMVSDPRPDGFEPVEPDRPLGTLTFQLIDGLSDRVDLRAGWGPRLDAFRRDVRGDAARESAWSKALLREILVKRRFETTTREQRVDLEDLVTPDRVEHRNDRSIFFLSPPYRRFQLTYLARAELPGRFHALPPRVEAMYAPEFRGSGRETSLEVGAPRLSGTPLAYAPGVEGLLAVLPQLGEVDADRLLNSISNQPRIGDLLAEVCGDRALEAWLSATPATSAAGPALRERLAAARQDLATRRLAVEALNDPRGPGLYPLYHAINDQTLSQRLLESADPTNFADNLLAWADEEDELRLRMLEVVQVLRSSAGIGRHVIPKPGFLRVMEALGSRAPGGDSLFQWKIDQTTRFAAPSLLALAERCERDLGLKLRILSGGETPVLLHEGTLIETLERTLAGSGLYYRIGKDEIVVGSLREVLR